MLQQDVFFETATHTVLTGTTEPVTWDLEDDFREHLERVAASVTFARSKQLQNLLRWLGERSLGAKPESPTEKEIARAVLRKPDLDPRESSLVRKEKSRLREKLTCYYQHEGAQDLVRILIASGYMLQFEKRARGLSPHTQRRWLLLPIRTADHLRQEADHMLEDILFQLSESPSTQVVSPTTAFSYRDRTGDIRQFAAECKADFAAEGSLREINGEKITTVWLVDGHDGASLRSARFSGMDCQRLATQISRWLLGRESLAAGEN